ncbi:MAG: hypothetical protein WBN00_04385 [Sedimenticolaceae bacterium]
MQWLLSRQSLPSMFSKEQSCPDERSLRGNPMSPSTQSSVNKSEKEETRANQASETERVAKMIHEAIDRLAVHAAEAEQRIKDAAADAQSKVHATKQNAKAKGSEAVTVTENYVDQHPWAALGIAFGAGIIISSLLRR